MALLGYDTRGRMVRKTVTAKSRAEVTRRLAQLRRQMDAGHVTTSKTPTLAELMTRWFEDVLSREIARSTFDNYGSVVKYHILPSLGKRRVTDIKVADVDSLLAAKLGEGLSPSTVHRIRALISQCLDQGVRWGDLPTNVARLSRSPKLVRAEGRTLTQEQAQSLLEALEGHPHEALYLLMLSTGLRRGEALGLTWQDVDLEAGIVRVRRNLKREGGRLVTADTKTLKSRRAVNLPRPVVEALRISRNQQEKERSDLGDAWIETDFVFTTSIGTPIDPRNLYREFTQICDWAGLGHWHPHELRHSAASLMLASGVKLQVVSEVLGHSSIRMTADVYGHILDPDRQQAASAMSKVLWGE
ncbi:MAG: site-specific integrase [Acidimicrobiales bacterium]